MAAVPVLRCESLSCRRDLWLELAPSRVEDVSAAFWAGEFCGFCGPDGSGKGLLLNILGLLERPDSGTITVNGIPTHTLTPEEFQQMRNETFGFLFNHPCLLPSFSVAENVAMPLFRICGGDAREARDRTLEVLEFCGISSLETTLAGRLDAAQRTRVALARALVHGPSILVVISPRESGELMALGRRIAEKLGLCVLWAGSEPGLLRHVHRLLHLDGGRIVRDDRP
jgi:ABC-type antimicrobial peptide transport system, ATPase component